MELLNKNNNQTYIHRGLTGIQTYTIYIKTQVFRLLRYYSPAPRNIARSDWSTQNIIHNITSSKTYTATETYPKLIVFTKKINGFLTVIKKSMVAEKSKSFTLNNVILRLCTLKKIKSFPAKCTLNSIYLGRIPKLSYLG